MNENNVNRTAIEEQYTRAASWNYRGIKMINGELKNKIDGIWNVFWSGGISNPLEVIEQITYLLFLRRLDDLHTLEENKSARLKHPMERRVFPEGNDPKGPPLRGSALVPLQTLRPGRDVHSC